jgi:hypothetical protein
VAARWLSAASVIAGRVVACGAAEQALLNDLAEGRLRSRSVRQTGVLGLTGGYIYSPPPDPRHERDAQAFWLMVRDGKLNRKLIGGYRAEINSADFTVSIGPRRHAYMQFRLPAVRTAELALKVGDVLPARQKEPHAGGRPRQFNWDIFHWEIIKIVDRSPDGVPDEATLRRMMEEFTAGWNKPPSLRSVRKKISDLYRWLRR